MEISGYGYLNIILILFNSVLNKFSGVLLNLTASQFVHDWCNFSVHVVVPYIGLRMVFITVTVAELDSITGSAADCSSSAAAALLLRPQPRELSRPAASTLRGKCCFNLVFIFLFLPVNTRELDAGMKISWLRETCCPSSSAVISEGGLSPLQSEVKLLQLDVSPFYFLCFS